MSVVYFDSSALMKLLVEEDGGELARSLWDGCDAPLSSPLAYPEVCAGLAALAHNHDLGAPAHARARREWDAFWGATRTVALSPSVSRRAGELAREQALRGADAVHLASAEAIGDPGLVVAAWDQRLHAAARARGLATAPATLA